VWDLILHKLWCAYMCMYIYIYSANDIECVKCVTSQKTCVFINSAVKISNIAKLECFGKFIQKPQCVISWKSCQQLIYRLKSYKNLFSCLEFNLESLQRVVFIIKTELPRLLGPVVHFWRRTCGTYEKSLRHAPGLSCIWKALLDRKTHWHGAPLTPQHCTRT
jgi:hypothetical protein